MQKHFSALRVIKRKFLVDSRKKLMSKNKVPYLSNCMKKSGPRGPGFGSPLEGASMLPHPRLHTLRHKGIYAL